MRSRTLGLCSGRVLHPCVPRPLRGSPSPRTPNSSLADQTAAVVDNPNALPPRGAGDSACATLPDAVRAVDDRLAGDDPAHTAAELRARVDTDNPSAADAETVVFARLLAALP